MLNSIKAIPLFSFILIPMISFSNEINLTDSAVAQKLNSRMNDYSSECNAKPAYYCSGIVIRSNEGEGYTWKLSIKGKEKEKIAFSYIRNDITNATKSIFSWNIIGYGIILKPAAQESYSTRCIFPIDGSSSSRKDHGCGDKDFGLTRIDEDNSNCKLKGVSTAEEWNNLTPLLEPYCSFSSHSPREFMESIKALNIYHQHSSIMWNELVLNASTENWDPENPGNDPIEALYYHKQAHGKGFLHGLAGAQQEQIAYHDITGKWIPIVSIDNNIPENPFGYSEKEQAVSPPQN